MRERRFDVLAVVLLGLIARLAVVIWAHARFPAAEDGHYYDVLARRIASGNGYTWLWPDGTVTWVAHYPVGYPALVALAYALFGAAASVAMLLNAVLGTAAAYGAYRLVDGVSVARWRPVAASLAVALHPALVPYTAALMTEGVTAALLLLASALATTARARARPWPWLAAVGVTLGLATLVRPQCLALAPIVGLFAVPAPAAMGRRLATAGIVSAIALGCILPWTVRNCERMHRCALVSVNGGWNLLIGASTENGAWQPMPVPVECATVWDEAGKDSCFERAAWRTIARAPGRWALRAPAKLAATFDYFGAAPWYLHASNAQDFDDTDKTRLGVFETAVCRLLLLGALAACGTLAGSLPRTRKIVTLVGAIGAITVHGWIGYLAIPVVVALAGWRALARGRAVVPIAAAVVATTGAVHAVFFGAGRYGLVVAPFVALLAFIGKEPAPDPPLPEAPGGAE